MGFQTLSADLIEFGERAVKHFRILGYTVRIEPTDPGFPTTPTIVCRRAVTQLHVHVTTSMASVALSDWLAYARSSGKDARVALLLPEAAWQSVSEVEKERVVTHGVGIYIASTTDIREHAEPSDIGVNVVLPARQALPGPLKRILGPAYDHFARRRWREGFDEACGVLETEARRYLKKWMRTGRIKIVAKGTGKLVALTGPQINRLTIGQLAKHFQQILNPTLDDSLIGTALKSVNPDRVARVHRKRQSASEMRLRQNVGQHMHAIIGALKHMGIQ